MYKWKCPIQIYVFRSTGQTRDESTRKPRSSPQAACHTSQPAGHMPHSSPQATCHTAARRPHATQQPAGRKPQQPSGHTHCSPQATLILHAIAARRPRATLQPASRRPCSPQAAVLAARRPRHCSPQATPVLRPASRHISCCPHSHPNRPQSGMTTWYVCVCVCVRVYVSIFLYSRHYIYIPGSTGERFFFWEVSVFRLRPKIPKIPNFRNSFKHTKTM